MDESVKCECGNENFWYFWGYVRCPNCYNEYKQTIIEPNDRAIKSARNPVIVENWVRRMNKVTHSFDNWEHYNFKK